MEAIRFRIKEDNRIIKKTDYIDIDTKPNSRYEVLDMWIDGNESVKYWKDVLNELKPESRRLMIVSVDRLTSFEETIHAVFLQVEMYGYTVHQPHYITKFIFYKDIKTFMKDLKMVCKLDKEW